MADKRKQRYQELIKAGFSPSEARKMRSWSESRVKSEIKEHKRQIRNLERAENYRKLREAGYSSKEAQKFRGYKPEKVQQLTVEISYEPIKPPFTYDYQSNYMYLFSYITKDKEGNKTKKFVAVGSDKKLSRRELNKQLDEIFAENAQLGKYEGDKIIPSSIELVAAYERPNK